MAEFYKKNKEKEMQQERKTVRAQTKREFCVGFLAGLSVIGGLALVLLAFFFL